VFRALGVEGATAASFVRPDVNAEAAHAEPSSATPAPLTPASHGDGDAETAASELQIAADAR
jgi:hypothetical protein